MNTYSDKKFTKSKSHSARIQISEELQIGEKLWALE